VEPIAHRCFAGIAPENTVAAARTAAAVADGPPTVEVDVHPTADDRVAVFHDARLDDGGRSRGITDGSGYVWESTAAELSERSVLGTDQGVPTLERLLGALPAGSRVVVELKSPGSDDLRFAELLDPPDRERRRERWTPFVERVAAVCEASDHEILFASFCEGALAAAAAVAPATPLAPIGHDDPAALWTLAERYDAAAVHPSLELLPGPLFGAGKFDPDGDDPETAGVPDLVARARDAGRELNAWTTRGWREADHLRRAGVDGVVADFPGLLRWREAGG